MWLSGASGLGKSTLFKALAGLWPHADGKVEIAGGSICFLPQQVYLPLDTLPAAAIYPALPDTLSRAEAEALLHKVGLGHRLAAEGEDGRGLSVGEQQRLALARVLAAKPDWVFLDEATSALDLESERKLMTLLRAELPDATFVVVAHREPQGLTNVVRIELSRQSADDRTLKLATHDPCRRKSPLVERRFVDQAHDRRALLLEARLARLAGVGLELQRDGCSCRHCLLRLALERVVASPSVAPSRAPNR